MHRCIPSSQQGGYSLRPTVPYMMKATSPRSIRLRFCKRNHFYGSIPTIFFNTVPQQDIYQIIHSNREEIPRPAGNYGAPLIRIFGSVTHHSADKKSNVDFLVELEPGRTLFDLGGFAYDLERLLGRPVDVCTLPLLREPIRTRVVLEVVPL